MKWNAYPKIRNYSKFSGPNNTASQRVSSELSRAIFIVIVSGTESSIPIGPRTQPQNISDKNTTRVDKPKPLPINLGSIIFPTRVFMITKPITTIIASTNQNRISANRAGGKRAKNEPIVGT